MHACMAVESHCNGRPRRAASRLRNDEPALTPIPVGTKRGARSNTLHFNASAEPYHSSAVNMHDINIAIWLARCSCSGRHRRSIGELAANSRPGYFRGAADRIFFLRVAVRRATARCGNGGTRPPEPHVSSMGYAGTSKEAAATVFGCGAL